MNAKRKFRTDWKPNILHEFDVNATGKVFRVTAGMLVSVSRRPNLIAGRYEIIYAEYASDGTLLITADGPITRQRRRKTIRETDIKRVHVGTKTK